MWSPLKQLKVRTLLHKVRGVYARTEETAPFYDWCTVLGVSSLVFLALCTVAFIQYYALDTHNTNPAPDARAQTIFNEDEAAQMLTLYREKKGRFDTRANMKVATPDIGAMPVRYTPPTVSATNTEMASTTARTGTERALPVE